MKALCDEALEILRNLWTAFMMEEIDEDTYIELRNNTLLEVVERAEARHNDGRQGRLRVVSV